MRDLAGFFLVALLIMVPIVLVMIPSDEERVKKSLSRRNGKFLKMRGYAPGNTIGRVVVYEVEYLDAKGERRLAECKPSLFGVQWFSDNAVAETHAANDSDRIKALEEETQRLKEELRRLKEKDKQS